MMKTTLFMLVSTVFVFLGCGSAVKLPPVQEPLDSGEWERCAGELEEREAIGLIDDLTLDSRTLLCRGVVLGAQGKTNQAIDLLTEAGVRDPEDHRPHYMSGRILAEAGRYEEALSAFERSMQRYPKMEVPTERLARKVAQTDGDDQARAFMAKATERGLCPYGCMGLLAKLQHKAGEDEEARETYGKMIEIDSAEPAAYVGLASLSNSASDYMAESEFLTKATEAGHFRSLPDKSKADIHYSHAFSRYNARKYKGAAKSIDRAIALNGGVADWWVLAGWIQLKLENPPIALTKFDKAAALDEKLAAAHTGRGDSMLEMTRNGDAAIAFLRAKKLDPQNTVIILKLAYARALNGQLEDASALVEEAKDIDAEHLPPELLGKVTKLLQKTAGDQ